jgi:hypothetical protein
MKHRVYDRNGNLLSESDVVRPQAPLDPLGAAMTLLAVLGVVPLDDAANAVGLTPADLVAEAQAWAVAMGANQ